MTRKEIIELLNILRSAYPNTKIPSPRDTVLAWELAFGDEPADVIYKAARHHMKTCKFFPVPADLWKGISKGQMLYGETEETEENHYNILPEAPHTLITVDSSFCELCELCDIRDQSRCPYDI